MGGLSSLDNKGGSIAQTNQAKTGDVTSSLGGGDKIFNIANPNLKDSNMATYVLIGGALIVAYVFMKKKKII